MDEELDALLSKFLRFETQIAEIPPLTIWMSRTDLHITTTFDFSTRLPAIEQSFNALTTRMCKFETGAASGSGVHNLSRSWKILGYSDGSTANGSIGSRGPGSFVDNRNISRRLDTFSSPEDEHARSAVLLRVPCEQYHTRITNWTNTLWEMSDIPTHRKTCHNLLQGRFRGGQICI